MPLPQRPASSPPSRDPWRNPSRARSRRPRPPRDPRPRSPAAPGHFQLRPAGPDRFRRRGALGLQGHLQALPADQEVQAQFGSGGVRTRREPRPSPLGRGRRAPPGRPALALAKARRGGGRDPPPCPRAADPLPGHREAALAQGPGREGGRRPRAPASFPSARPSSAGRSARSAASVGERRARAPEIGGRRAPRGNQRMKQRSTLLVPAPRRRKMPHAPRFRAGPQPFLAGHLASTPEAHVTPAPESAAPSPGEPS